MKSKLWDFEANTPLDHPSLVVLGVDGGSTSTLCVCLEANHHSTTSPSILSRAVAGCSNHNSVGEKTAREALETVLAGALKNAGRSRSAVRAVCLGVSGVDTPDDEEHLLSWLRLIFPCTQHLYVYNDAVAALASGTYGSLHGCVLVVGTGTISYGFTAEGLKARSSGYGPLLGDQGSGYAIASQALAAVMRAQDGRGPPTSLSEAILTQLKLKNFDDLLSWAYADSSWARVAALVPVVKACAAAGDKVAQNVLYVAVQELALNVVSVVQRLKLAGEDGRQAFPLVLVGGVLERHEPGFDISAAVVECVRNSFPYVQAIRPKVEPAVGAAMLARMKSSVTTTTTNTTNFMCNGSANALEV